MGTKIKSIKFTKTETYIGFVESAQPRDSNDIVNDKMDKRCDLPRHADFERAMDKLKPHLLIACELQKPEDCNGNYLQPSHFDSFIADEDEEKDGFGGLDITGILIQGKHAADGVQIFGTKTTSAGEVIKIKTPSIPLKRVPEGYNYPLIDILDNQIDVLLEEAILYNQRKKHGAGVQRELPLPNVPDTNTKTGRKREQNTLEVA